MHTYRSLLLWMLLLTSILQAYCQKDPKADFRNGLTALFLEKYNIEYLPSGFYDCSYERYLKDGGDNFETGYQMARQCLPAFFSQMKFSDKGAKLMASFEDVFVLTCNKQIEAYSDQIKGADYCKCLHSQYVKYGVGFDDLNDLGFTDGEFHENMIDFCMVTSEGDIPKDNKEGIPAKNSKAIDPKDAFAYWSRGNTKEKLEDYYGAIQDYTKAIELDPKEAYYYGSRGYVKGELEDYYGAIQDFSKSIELNPEYAGAYFNRGIAKYNLGDYRGAIQDYTKAIELDPKYASAYNNRGEAKYHLGDKNGGCLDLSKAGELGYDDAYDSIRELCN